ncbi:MAG TPA: SDR family NAD(P)-dependent oxidoreductase [Nitrospirae bacterium]|nr:dTDP-L-rhamnose 4-epimerase [bacterium BMS3Abin06]HDH12747.1 SDR family NAD(P)-dependent oxidoreductase [Nitrospirota bacterium]HDZ00056.1 SDR family NAD(P)-dependent oxidoreductase [Nitrospirota bacterium]
MNILVTGGAGFIGSHTVDRLLAKGHKVRILDNLQKPVHLKGKPDYIPEKAEFIEGDVRDKATLENSMKGVDAIYHLAAYQDYLPDFSTYFHVNSVSTALIYEIIVEKNLPVQKVIVASSQAVSGEGLYRCEEHGELIPDIRLEEQLSKGDWEHHCPYCGKYMNYIPTPETRIKPQNQYAMSKHSQEIIAVNLGKRYGIPSVALRYSIVQGPRQSFYNAYSGAMRIFNLHLYFDRQPTVYEDGMQIRDYINYRDVVDANIMVLENDKADYQSFNVGGGRAYTVIDFYNRVQKVTGKHIEPVIAKYYRYGDTRHIFSDISKLKSLGWEPGVPIEESIEEYWEYLKKQTDIDDILEYAEKTMMKKGVVRAVK